MYVCVCFPTADRDYDRFPYKKKSLYKLITSRTNKLPQNYYTTEHTLSISRVFRNTDIMKGASINAQIKSD